MNNDQQSDLRKIIKHFGFTAQLDKQLEENNEFEEAVAVFLENKDEKSLEDVIFEYVDRNLVSLQLIYQMAKIADIKHLIEYVDTTIENATSYKIKRTLDRIDSRYYEEGKYE